MKTTVPEEDEPRRVEWCLFVVAHPDPALVGARRVLLHGSRVELGREDDSFGPGALADGRISRKHARIEVDASGALRVADLGSSNGTHVNGARVELVTLAPGDVVRIGGVLLVAQRAPLGLRAPRAALAGVGPALARMQSELDRVAAYGRDVALVEEPGAGAIRVAQWLAAQRGGPLHEWSLNSWVDRLPVPFEESLVAQEGGVLIVKSLPPKGTLARSLAQKLLASERRDGSAQRVFLVDARSPGDSELARLMGVERVYVPALRDRPEDVAHAARAWSESRGTPVPELSLRAWLELVRAPWPTNLAQLEATLDRARAAMAAGEPEDIERWIADSARNELAPTNVAPATEAASDGPAFVFAESGKWFSLPSGERVSLHRRDVLARVLGALVRARIDHPGRVVRAEQLIEHAWAGERFIEGSGENRLHVALSNLRQLGLRPAITRIEDGYRIDPEVAARFVSE
ncbi:MAG: FHA domain-containing protein [Myxococcales bacterium]|nr:FHA domain-containing protein [Myxococcales bacterium]